MILMLHLDADLIGCRFKPLTEVTESDVTDRHLVALSVAASAVVTDGSGVLVLKHRDPSLVRRVFSMDGFMSAVKDGQFR